MKKLLIIIPGSKTESSILPKKILNKFFSHYKVETKNNNWPYKLKKFIDKEFDVKIFEWSGGITETFSLNPESKKLAALIEKSEKYNKIVLIGKSLGGIIAEKAIKRTKPKNVSKIIYIATPHKNRKKQFPKNIQIINIYSNQDEYQKLANKILYCGLGKTKLKNAKNIEIRNLNHSDFNHNRIMKINNRKTNLFEYYNKIISKP